MVFSVCDARRSPGYCANPILRATGLSTPSPHHTCFTVGAMLVVTSIIIKSLMTCLYCSFGVALAVMHTSQVDRDIVLTVSGEARSGSVHLVLRWELLSSGLTHPETKEYLPRNVVSWPKKLKKRLSSSELASIHLLEKRCHTLWKCTHTYIFWQDIHLSGVIPQILPPLFSSQGLFWQAKVYIFLFSHQSNRQREWVALQCKSTQLFVPCWRMPVTERVKG